MKCVFCGSGKVEKRYEGYECKKCEEVFDHDDVRSIVGKGKKSKDKRKFTKSNRLEG